ncbi:MAG TPA: HPr family phosphocarrier protein [Actinomycetaceae bacterium]|nr:HPr family phosphocarrier protein [Actinomycetaceae bacterium]
MPQRSATVASLVGLHARPASLFVKAATRVAARTGGAVRIRLGDGEAVDATSILAVMTLGVRHGDTVTLEADGPGAAEALGELAALLEQDLQ